ncbi:hypothetical protein AK830_g12682 [Neonectria ditissima]|uniref:Uncharacterized protein n=1 Tax=Neonectria ditissima TaxID=78410 RepID=A0A0P7AZX9_9HYPO|nr:hypothetical protein AK830_g12682 [Neonectria ditissima]
MAARLMIPARPPTCIRRRRGPGRLGTWNWTPARAIEQMDVMKAQGGAQLHVCTLSVKRLVRPRSLGRVMLVTDAFASLFAKPLVKRPALLEADQRDGGFSRTLRHASAGVVAKHLTGGPRIGTEPVVEEMGGPIPGGLMLAARGNCALRWGGAFCLIEVKHACLQKGKRTAEEGSALELPSPAKINCMGAVLARITFGGLIVTAV